MLITRNQMKPRNHFRSLMPWRVCLGSALFMVAMFGGFTASAASKQASWPVTAGGNGHTYRVVSQAGLVSWDSAQAAAEAAGGYLATITSPSENAFIFSLIDDPAYWNQTANGHGPWIGAYQPTGSTEPDGGWSWVPRSGEMNAELFSYANWETGEPNNFVSNSQILESQITLNGFIV